MVNLYQGLGITGGMVLILGALYVTVATAANFLASFVMDYVGRVRLLSEKSPRTVSPTTDCFCPGI